MTATSNGSCTGLWLAVMQAAFPDARAGMRTLGSICRGRTGLPE